MELFFVFLPIVLYFCPALIAFSKKHTNRVAIFIINLFLGWTIIGWVIALVMTVMKEKEPVVIKKEDDKYDNLVKLQKLKENNIISEEEFNKEKKKLLE